MPVEILKLSEAAPGDIMLGCGHLNLPVLEYVVLWLTAGYTKHYNIMCVNLMVNYSTYSEWVSSSTLL